ncbi:extracellular solute-binding protein [Paenibacillus psychroresistens]|uniref:Extracellular solute-binding protein n=1 Tax=Paenibacillus psychroresistens TaxID=1778678 RepID=A0A6B8RU78_9BACL|nr:extracellular solute-binding protein [Paenibacillus psychroresistens]QGQ99155.1 extracellular solute-binding protein [Paenibacillus psychroresistens]
MKKMVITLLSLTIAGSMLAACTNKAESDTTEQVLRIASAFGNDEDFIREQYTQLFELANENIKVEVITTENIGGKSIEDPSDPDGSKVKSSLDIMMDLMEGPNPPDVVLLGAEQIKAILSKNLLAPLDAQINKTKFDTTDIVPLVLESLKSFSEDGQLYALSPTFNSSALIYNKQMFIDAGVTDLPRDNMTWDEVFALAKRLTHGDGADHKYGISLSSQSNDGMLYELQPYIQPLQLHMYDELGEKMTVDTPQWQDAITTLSQLQKDKIIPSGDNPPKGPLDYDDFLSGRVAMAIVNYGQLEQLNNANKNADAIKGYTKIDWDTVTVPSFPEAPGVVANIGFNSLMAINAKSTNLETAWKFLEFSNGEKWAQLKSHSTYQMVARKKYIQPQLGIDFNIAAFYNNIKQAPMFDNNKLYREKTNIWVIDQIGQNILQDIITNKKSVKEALVEWETKGNLVLQKIKENPNAEIDPSLYQSDDPNNQAPGVHWGG